MVRLHISFLSNGAAARLYLSFLSQWCSYSSLFPLNGAAAHFSSLSLVRLYLSLLSQLHLYHALNQSLSCYPPPHLITFYYIPKTFPFSSLRSVFFFFNVLKTSFPKEPFPSLYLPKKPSSFIHHLFSLFMPQIYHSKTSVIPSHKRPLHSFPLTPPTWKDHSPSRREPTIICVMLSHLPKNILHAISCVSCFFF